MKSVPIIQATLDPTGPIPLACMNVAIPAASIVALISAVDVFASKPNELLITSGTTIIPPNAANIC